MDRQEFSHDKCHTTTSAHASKSTKFGVCVCVSVCVCVCVCLWVSGGESFGWNREWVKIKGKLVEYFVIGKEFASQIGHSQIKDITIHSCIWMFVIYILFYYAILQINCPFVIQIAIVIFRPFSSNYNLW